MSDIIRAGQRGMIPMMGRDQRLQIEDTINPELALPNGVAPYVPVPNVTPPARPYGERADARPMVLPQQFVPEAGQAAASPDIEESKFADMFKRQYLAREQFRNTPYHDMPGYDPGEDAVRANEQAAASQAEQGLEAYDPIRSMDSDAAVADLDRFGAPAGFDDLGPSTGFSELAPIPDQEAMGERVKNAAKPRMGGREVDAPPEVKGGVPSPRPALNARAEELRPGPDEVAEARKPKPPAPRDPRLRDSYLRTVWPQIKQFAIGRGVNENVLRDVYETAAAEGGHAAGVQAMKGVIADLKSDTVASAEKRRREQLIEDGQARRMGVSPQAYQNYLSIRQDPNVDDTTAHLIMLHHQYPNMGYGNLAAMHMRNQAGNQQAANLRKDDQNQLPAEKQAANLAAIQGMGPSAATIPALEEHFRATLGGKAEPREATKYALQISRKDYMALHGKQDLTPDQEAFVRRWVGDHRTYQDFRNSTGLPDSEELRKWWTQKTNRPAETFTERLQGTVAAGAGAVGGFLRQGLDAITGAKPPPDAVAKAGKGGRKPRTDVFKE